MEELSAWLDAQPRSSWGELDTLRQIHATRPDLPREMLQAVQAGTLALPGPPTGPATLGSVLQWIGTDRLQVPSDLLLAHLDGPEASSAASALGSQWDRTTRERTEALLAEPTPERRALGFHVLATALHGERVEPADARRLLPLAAAGKKRITKKHRCPTVFVLQQLEARGAQRPEAPAATDIAALAAEAPDDEALHHQAARVFTGRSWMSFEELADRLDVSSAASRAVAAALAQSSPGVHWSERGLSTSHVYAEAHAAMWPAPPNVLERLAIDCQTEMLDALLQPTPRLSLALQKRSSPEPPLRWIGGAVVGPQASRFLIACMPNRDPVSRALVELLEPASLDALGGWLLSEPAKHQRDRHLLPPSDNLARLIGRAWAAGTSKLRPWKTLGLDDTRTHRRQLFRWWTAARPRDRFDMRPQGASAPLALVDVLPYLPTDEELDADGTNDAPWWIGLGRAALRDAMAAQCWLWGRSLRELANHSVGESVLEGVVFLGPDGSVQTLATGLNAPVLRVASALIDAPKWPMFDDPLGQREDAVALPEVSTLPAFPSTEWQRRTQALGYTEVPESSGGSRRLIRRLGSDTLMLGHSGTGKGYGRGPVRLERVWTERGEASNVVARNALARDVLALNGLLDRPDLPAPVPLPPPDQIARPTPPTSRSR